ncbi:hypothetical protein D1872_73260 [compost metagenome]
MSTTEQEVQVEETGFKTVGEYVEHLKASGEEAVIVADVVATLEGILSRPAAPTVRRGQLSGINLTDMTDEQLKRELINSKSVLYKATQRGASQETIAKNQARVDAAEAEKQARPSMAKAATEEAPVEGDAPAEVAADPLDEVVGTDESQNTSDAEHPVNEEL